jgi:alpha-L-fucosidase
VTSLKGAGFRQAMLVTKHSCGFMLWPSQYADYSTKNSTWKGDVLQLWTDAMKANDMRVAIYYSPWDQPAPVTANLLSIREAIELGERVKQYHIDIQQNGTWNTSP